MWTCFWIFKQTCIVLKKQKKTAGTFEFLHLLNPHAEQHTVTIKTVQMRFWKSTGAFNSLPLGRCWVEKMKNGCQNAHLMGVWGGMRRLSSSDIFFGVLSTCDLKAKGGDIQTFISKITTHLLQMCKTVNVKTRMNYISTLGRRTVSSPSKNRRPSRSLLLR